MIQNVEPQHLCRICGMPVSLETCIVDERGHAVHELCYSSQLAAEKRDRLKRSA
jgi:hypothetical protein